MTPYLVKASTSSSATQIKPILEDLKQQEVPRQVHNIEEIHLISEVEVKDKVNLDPKAEENRPNFDEPMIIVQLGSLPTQTTRVGKTICRALRNEIEQVLLNNVDLFAWSPADMPNIDPDFMFHKLAILP